MIKKNAGVLLRVASLPGDQGIGDFSVYAYQFVDWLKEHHYHYWQILPLNPVGPGYSPYVTICSEAIDIRYIYLSDLVDQGLLKNVPDFQKGSISINYDDVLSYKEKYLRKAYKKSTYNLNRFKNDNPWAVSYGEYLVLKKINNDKIWNEWDIFDIPNELQDEVNYHIWCQYVAYKQWNKIVNYAHAGGVKIIADCPFYVGLDSVDCYLHQDEFMFDENRRPTLVSGCPPDAFSDDGQMWGTPIYNFEKMKENNYSFLINRIGFLSKHCDYLRLDHFRAFDTYCVIPAEDENAKRGEWKIGPRHAFFDELYRQYPEIKIIAEDLGILFDSVHELRDDYHLPGMRVIEFCIFEELEDNDNIVLYPGTHDNQTLYGWIKSLDKKDTKKLKEMFDNTRDLYTAVFDFVWNMKSLITIIPLQDLLKLDDKARINRPGTVGKPNWCFKLKDMSWINRIKFGQ